MRHINVLIGLILTVLFLNSGSPVFAWSYGVMTVTPTPTVTPSATPTPITVHTSSCDSLSVISGNNSTVPATLTFRAGGSDNRGSVKMYRFFYGDGRYDETASSEVTHRYEVSGSFLARAEIKDSEDVWKGSGACESTVTIQSAPLETFKSDCSDLFVTDGNNAQAPTTARYIVTGYDNKGTLKRYKVDYGDGTNEEKTDNRFEKQYNTPGTYTIRGYVMDSRDSWKGGAGSCEKTVYVNTTPLTKQPSTGTPTAFTIVALTGGLWSLSMFLARRYF